MSEQQTEMLDDHPLSPRPRTSRRRAVIVGSIVLAIALGITVVVLVGRASTSDVVRYTGSAGNLTGGPATIGRTVYTAPMLYPASEVAKTTTDLVSARALVTENSADADVRVLICTYNGHILWTLTTDPFQFCSSVRPFAPGRQTIGQPNTASGTTLILAITAHRAGTVRINGVRTAYRHGSFSNGMNIDLRVAR